MLVLRTGLPGASKTLSAIYELCLSEHAGKVSFYYHNIKYFALDLDSVSTFGTWFFHIWLANNKSSPSIDSIISARHQSSLLVTDSDFSHLIPEYQIWLETSGPINLYLKWVKIAYNGNKNLSVLLDYIKRFPRCSLSELKQFNLHWIYLSDPSEWYNLPHPVQILLDECQKTFPPRPNGSRVPRHVTEFETHRHLGTDVHLITQDAKLLDSNVRRLAGKHIHYVNLFGSKRVRRMEWNESSDPSDYHCVKLAVSKVVRHPVSLYGIYFSALKHTHKLKLPIKVFLPVLFLFAFCFLVFHLFSRLDSEPKQVSAAELSSVDSPGQTNITPLETIENPLPGCVRLGFSGFNFVKDKWVPYFNCFTGQSETVTIESSSTTATDTQSDPSADSGSVEKITYSYESNKLVTPDYLLLFGYQMSVFQNMLILTKKNQIIFVTFMD